MMGAGVLFLGANDLLRSLGLSLMLTYGYIAWKCYKRQQDINTNIIKFFFAVNCVSGFLFTVFVVATTQVIVYQSLSTSIFFPADPKWLSVVHSGYLMYVRAVLYISFATFAFVLGYFYAYGSLQRNYCKEIIYISLPTLLFQLVSFLGRDFLKHPSCNFILAYQSPLEAIIIYYILQPYTAKQDDPLY
jgi:hypothetical protein